MTRNFIYHRTLDSVHLDQCRTWCDSLGTHVQQSFPSEALIPDDAAGVLIDLDHLALSIGERRFLVQQLGKQDLPIPVAVHSFNLEAEEIQALRDKGVVVGCGLEEPLIQSLVRMAQGYAIAA